MKGVSGVAKSRVVSLGKSRKADAVIGPAITGDERERETDCRLSPRAYFQRIIIYNPADPLGLELSSTVLVYLVKSESVLVLEISSTLITQY